MSKSIDRLYRSLPVWAQNAAITAYGAYWRSQRLGGRFGEYLSEFRARDGLSPAQMDDYLESQLRKHLVLAFEQVPHYQIAWADSGLSRREIERGELAQSDRATYVRTAAFSPEAKTAQCSKLWHQ